MNLKFKQQVRAKDKHFKTLNTKIALKVIWVDEVSKGICEEL